MIIPASQSPRRVRRQGHSRVQRLHSFSRSWGRALAAGAVLGLAHSAQAAPTATYAGTDGNYSTSGNFKSGGSTVVPDGSNGIFYAVSITGADITHDHSTGVGGVDTIASLTTDSNFYLSGGILAGSGANRSSIFSMSSSKLFQLSGGATLRNFTVTGAPITMNGSGTLDNVSTGLNGTIFGTLTFANNTLATVSGGNSLSLGNYYEGAETLTGAGTLVLGDGGGTGTLNVGQGDTGVIGAGTTVSGQGLGGVINGDNGGSALTNNGTIQASGGGTTLTIQGLGGGFTNNTTLQAINGGTLNLNSSVTNAGAILAAAGSTVALNNIGVTGGTLSTAGSGVVTSTTSNLVNVTTGAGTAVSVLGGRTNAFGTFTNNGTVTVATGNALGLGSYYDGSQTLTGAGTVALTGGTLDVGQGDGATIGAGQTISGAGVINGDNGGSALTNSGTIQASGGTLTVQGLTASGGFTNTKTLQVLGGATLNLNNSLLNTGTFSAATGGTINLNGVTLTGTDGTTTGLLSTAGSGVVTSTTSNLVNVTTGAGTAVSVLGGRTNAFGTFTNNGTVTVATGNALGLGSYYDGSQTLTGAGTVALTGGTLDVGQGDGATIGAGQTVTATGTNASILNGDNGGSALTNSGTIQASGGTLTVQGLTASGGFVNAAGGLVQSINGGTFNLDNNVVGNLLVDGASTFNLNGVNASGGILSGPGAFTLFNASLSTETISTNLNLTAQDPNSNPVGNPIGNGTFNGTNTLTGSSRITVGGGNALSLGNYYDGVPETLTGLGSVILGDANGSGTLNIGQGDAGTIDTNVTVTSGSGRTGIINGDNGASTLANNGTIRATGAGSMLTIQGLNGGFTNSGTIQALSGSTLNLNTNLTNLGLLTAGVGSTLDLNNMSLTGASTTNNVTTTGLLSSTGTGAVNVTTSNLVNVTSNASVSVLGGRTNAFGTFTNNGTVTVATGNALGLGSYYDGSQTLTGAGTVALTGGTLDVGQGDGATIGAGQTVTATGTNASILNGDNGGSALTNSGTIQASGGTLTVQNLSGGFTSSEGHFAAVNGGTLNVNSALTGGSTGTLTASPTGTINLNNALTQDKGTSQIDGIVNMGSGNTLTVTGGTLKGSGTVNGSVAVSGGDVAPGDSPGTLAVGGDYAQTGGALDIEYTASLTQPTAHDLLTVSGTATLGGVLNISFLGPGVNGKYLATAGEPGTTFDFLTFGTLGNANGLNGLFTNEYSVGSSYFINGIPQDSVAGAPAQYRLTFDPNNGKALQLSLTTTATPEPSQWAAFSLGVLGLTGLGLRARRKPGHSA